MTEWKLGVLDGVLGALSFWHGTADVLTRHARGEGLTDEEEHRLHLVAFAGMRVGEQLLRAESAEDHQARIFKAVEAPELMRLSALGLRWTLRGGRDAAFEHARAAVVPDLFDVFGRGAIPCLKGGDPSSALVAISMTQRFRHAGGQDIWIQVEDMLRLLCDPALPLRIGLAAAEAAKGAACFTAMAHAVLTRTEVRPVIAATLAEQWVAGTRQMLWLLASMPGVRMPPELVSPYQRFDVERMFADLEAKRTPEPPLPEGFGPPLPPEGFDPQLPPWLPPRLGGPGLGPPPGFGPPPPPSAAREPKT
jgi:hypothetical protein